MARGFTEHQLEPWFDKDARVLILGTLPSPKSRESGCYYGHPQNRFWTTLATVFREEVPQSVEERREFVRRHRIALWDVVASCEIQGAEDASIRSPIPNDLSLICNTADIKAIFTTGKKAKELYDRLILPRLGRKAIGLPSTSPANCRWFDRETLVDVYRVILEYVGD